VFAALCADPRVERACWLMGNHDAAAVGLVERRAVWQQMKASAPPALLRDLDERLTTGV
jgi:hypothetical protein